MGMTQQPGVPPAPPVSLLQHDQLVMQQVTNFNSNDIAILDPAGATVGYVHTVGSGVSRFFMGSRELDLLDRDGTPLAHISDPVQFGRDRFELTYPDGRPLAQVVKRIRLFGLNVSVEVCDGSVLELRGNVMGFDFQVMLGEWEIATVTRQWAGMGAALLGRSRYGVRLRNDAPDPVRRAVISSCVVLDLIREKRSRN
jgi:uncharacterized protein YxjI